MGERTAEEWGRVAVSLPGFRWMPGAGGWLQWPGEFGARDWRRVCADGWDPANDESGTTWIPDPDDHATEGCLIRLLGSCAGFVVYSRERGGWLDTFNGWTMSTLYPTLGRACVAHAARRAGWPGGAS